MGNGKAAIAAEVKMTIDEHGRRIRAHGFLGRGDGTGVIVADQNSRLAFYWFQSTDGVRTVGEAVLHPQSSIMFKNAIEYENIPVDIGKVEHDNTLYIMGQNSFGVASGGGTTIIEREIIQAAQTITLPFSVVADPVQPSLTVYITAYNIDKSGTLYQFPTTAQDLTAYIPGSANQMRYAVLFLQNDYATIDVFASTPRSTSGLPLGIADVQEARTASTGTDLIIFAVKLVNGQTTITQNDLNIDGQPWQQYVNV